ncbi:MAG TPA: EamA family transporter [Streptosporangiaceae bacterium]
MLRRTVIDTAPPWSFFAGSAVFHYLGPAFAVLLFVRLAPLGVAGLRIWSAALVFALWRRPWRALARMDGAGRRIVAAWAAVLAIMNACFYLAIDRLPLGTVAAIEFLPVIALAALGARTARNAAALAAAVAGVYVLTDVRLTGQPLGFVFAFANAGLFAAYIVLAHRAARRFTGTGGTGSTGASGIDGLAAAMLLACVVVAPAAIVPAAPALADPLALAAGVGVGISSSVIPYVCDQLAMARLPRSTYALLVSLLPATATVIGVVVLRQIPTPAEIAGVALVIAAVALHNDPAPSPDSSRESRTREATESAKETAKLPKRKID